jgi:hypothetical protein
MSFECTFKANLVSQKHYNVPKVYPSISMDVDIFENILVCTVFDSQPWCDTYVFSNQLHNKDSK